MNLKVRNSFAVAAVGALACSLAYAPNASAAQSPVTADDNSAVSLEGSYWGRVSGQSRFGTAVAASKALENPGDFVIIANSTSWSDTLASTPLADVLDAPVLYTKAFELHAETAEEIQRLASEEGVTNVILLGGELAINDAVVADLEALDLGLTIDRIGGDSRYDTALLLASEAIDYYEDGIGDLAADRAAIAELEELEQAYQDALAAWEAANEASGEAFQAVLDANDALEAAEAALAEASAGIVDIPGVEVELPDGTIVNIADLEEYNGLVIDARNAASDFDVLTAFVNGILVQYVNDLGSDFQDDAWDAVVTHFGSTSFSVTLSDGTHTGSLADLSIDVTQLADAIALGSDPAKQVEQNLAEAGDDADEAVTAIEGQFAAIVAQIVDRADAIENNEQQQRAIAEAFRDVEAAQAAVDSAVSAHFDARADEDDARTDLLDAAEARPSASDFAHAELLLEATLESVQADGRKYPTFLATGLDFPDALAAGPAAAAEAGVVVLTRGESLTEDVAAFLENGSNQIAVGGPAAAAAPEASEEYVGYSRYETATLLAAAYFEPDNYIGLASGAVSADAVVGGALMANLDSTLVLTRVDSLPETTATFLSYEADEPHLIIFGGPLAINNDVRDAAIEALQA